MQKGGVVRYVRSTLLFNHYLITQFTLQQLYKCVMN